MIKKTFFIPLFALALFTSSTAFAQSPQTTLPSAGLTPESAFYFLDTFGESLREFFTFNPEGKARLHVTFAAERIAEIKVILETKGAEARGLEEAKSRLQAHLATVSTILDDEKTKGKDVSVLASELDDDFDDQKDALKQVFKEQKNVLKEKEAVLKQKIKEARQVGNATQVETLLAELVAVKAEKDALELKEEEHEEALEAEQEKIEREMEDKTEAEKAIREAEKEKQEMLDEAAQEDIAVPTDAFEKFDRLLAQAKELFDRGNYQGAEQLAEQAEKSLDKIEDAIEELDEAKEEADDIEEELKEKEQEAMEERDDRSKDSVKREAERLEREQEEAKKRAEQAEEQLNNIGDED